MKIILFILLGCAIMFPGMAYSDSIIPSTIRDNAERMSQNGFTQRDMGSILEDLAGRRIFKNIAYDDVQSHAIPNVGQTAFVRISGQIMEHGKTGLVSITVIKPDNSTEVLQTPVSETGRYSTYFPVDHSYQSGAYMVFAKFGSNNLPVTQFHLGVAKSSTIVPAWLETNFQWWVEKDISEEEFVESIQYMIDKKIINITLNETKLPSDLQVSVHGQQMVRRGTTHTITSHVTDGINAIEGAKVTLRIEDYGEDLVRQFEGFTNRNGDFVFSWEIPKSFDDIETLLAYISVTYGDSSETKLFKFQVYCLPGEPGCKIDGN